MNIYDDFIKALCNETKWKEPKVQENKYHYFDLVGKNNEEYRLELFTPENTLLIMQVKLATLPNNASEKNELLDDYAKRQVAVCKTRTSILTVDSNTILLYKKEVMHDIQALLKVTSLFLKDVDWWFSNNQNLTSSQELSFSMSWKK